MALPELAATGTIIETVLVTAVDTRHQFRRLCSAGGTATRWIQFLSRQQVPVGYAARRA